MIWSVAAGMELNRWKPSMKASLSDCQHLSSMHCSSSCHSLTLNMCMRHERVDGAEQQRQHNVHQQAQQVQSVAKKFLQDARLQDLPH